MTLRISTATANRMMGEVSAVSGTTIALVAASNKVTDSGDTLLEEGFCPGDVLLISGSTTEANNIYVTVTSVASDGSEMTISAVDTNDSANANLTVTGMPKGFKQLFKYGILDIYSSTQPATADAVETGTLLVSLTVDAGAFTAGTSTNGLEFNTISDGKLSKSTATWQGTAVATGTAGWGRFYGNQYITGADTDDVAVRFDGQCGSAYEFALSNLSIETGSPVTCDQMDLTHRTVPAT